MPRAQPLKDQMDGVLVVDKPRGLTSHDVVAIARRSLRESRIGHTGTLDPLATGVLPLACGRATRLVRFLTASDKDYEASIRFGLATDTYDVTGTEVSRSGLVPARDVLERAIDGLRGEYDQLPPPFSAKKVDGRRAYVLARRDEPVRLTPARVRVMRADIVDFSGGVLRVAMTCSAGFYVRSFAHALGEAVGTGACLEGLRRTRSGDFPLDHAVTLEHLQAGAAAVQPQWIGLEALLPSLPALQLTPEGCRRVGHGQDVSRAHATSEGAPLRSPGAPERKIPDWIRLFDAQGRLLAIARADEVGDLLHPTVVLA